MRVQKTAHDLQSTGSDILVDGCAISPSQTEKEKQLWGDDTMSSALGHAERDQDSKEKVSGGQLDKWVWNPRQRASLGLQQSAHTPEVADFLSTEKGKAKEGAKKGP